MFCFFPKCMWNHIIFLICWSNSLILLCNPSLCCLLQIETMFWIVLEENGRAWLISPCTCPMGPALWNGNEEAFSKDNTFKKQHAGFVLKSFHDLQSSNYVWHLGKSQFIALTLRCKAHQNKICLIQQKRLQNNQYALQKLWKYKKSRV